MPDRLNDTAPDHSPEDAAGDQPWEMLVTYLRDRDRETASVLRQLNLTLAQQIQSETAPPPRGLTGRLAALFQSQPEPASTTVQPRPLATPFRVRHPRLVADPDVTWDKKVIGVTLFGFELEKMLSVLDTITGVCQSQDAVPILLTDSDAFGEFRSRGLAFEYLPPQEQRAGPGAGMDWPIYYRRRLSLFLDKWQPDAVISFGSREPVSGFRALLDRLDS